MESTNGNSSAKIITALIIGLIVGFLAGAFWQARRTNLVTGDTTVKTVKTEVTGELAAVAESNTASTTKKTVAPAKGLIVKDQTAGDKVEVANVDAKEVMWVAVREVSSFDGKLGNILGAQKVFVGDGQKATVELLRPIVAGSTYKVVVYKDVGAAAFNYREDTLVEGVEATFKAK